MDLILFLLMFFSIPIIFVILSMLILGPILLLYKIVVGKVLLKVFKKDVKDIIHDKEK